MNDQDTLNKLVITGYFVIIVFFTILLCIGLGNKKMRSFSWSRIIFCFCSLNSSIKSSSPLVSYDTSKSSSEGLLRYPIILWAILDNYSLLGPTKRADVYFNQFVCLFIVHPVQVHWSIISYRSNYLKAEAISTTFAGLISRDRS